MNKIKYSEERDHETGFSYFGARYYDPDLSALWLSVDPMADKYPGISPYAYCAWNPMRLVDPCGSEIDISFLEKKNKRGEYIYDNLRKAFIFFVNTNTGKRELSKYAKKGQVIYGVHFDEDGDYHKKGIDISFSNFSQSGISGTTFPHIVGERLSIEINTTNFSNVSDCLENIGHEFFIHASQAVKDFRDNGILDHSYLPQKLISKANNSKNSRNLAYANILYPVFQTMCKDF